MELQRVLLLSPALDASPSQGLLPECVAGTLLYTWVERDSLEQSPLSKEAAESFTELGIEAMTLWLGVRSPEHCTTVSPRMVTLINVQIVSMLGFSSDLN